MVRTLTLRWFVRRTARVYEGVKRSTGSSYLASRGEVRYVRRPHVRIC